ncbi:MAG: glycosyl hydrolase [Beijerinckiaceae bacterium]|nr:glycosyl hydrolase [Beijerinckiaceae bacterium]MCI0734934.1 glycosyl hydrolase [Beijerinckiaceae bacterium]
MQLRSVPRMAAVAALLTLMGGDAHAATRAVRANDFLNSIGVITKISQGVDYTPKVIPALTYIGARNIRDGGRIPSLLVSVHNATGAKVCMLPWPGNIGETIPRLEQLAAAGALLAAEGPNEPNNFPFTYQGEKSGFKTTFLPVAKFQRDLYAAVKSNPRLRNYPVFHSSEAGGAEPNNVGLQFLTIPSGAGTIMPAGTKYADYANVHNYIIANGFKQPKDNNAWGAAAPGYSEGPYDGMYPEYGRTWHKHFAGYTIAQLPALPRVTTETGWFTKGINAITEDQQGKLYLHVYLAQYKRGWRYTFIYMLRDDPNQGYWGFFHPDYTPKLSGTYLHNLTAILADKGSIAPESLNYSIPLQPATVHDLLIQKSTRTFELVVWNERVIGSDSVTVNLGATFPIVKVYDPTLGTSPAKTLSNVASVNLTLSDHPVIIEIPR